MKPVQVPSLDETRIQDDEPAITSSFSLRFPSSAVQSLRLRPRSVYPAKRKTCLKNAMD